MSTTPAPAPAEAATIARFGIFEAEERVEQVARAMWETHGRPSGWWDGSPAVDCDGYRRLAVAAIAALAASPAEVAVRRVEALIDPEAGMATGNGYDATRLFDEKDIRAALAPQAGEAGQ